MLNSAKGIFSRRAPARFAGLSKPKENETEEEKQERYNNSAVGKSFNWWMQNVVPSVEDYIDSRVENYNEILANGDGNLLLGILNTTAKDVASLGVSKTTNQSGASAKPVIYSDWSPASKLFGMNQETAFSEHLANTAHQREVADLKAAGLNPVLGVSGSGATSVSGNAGVGSSSALKADENGFLDVLGATAAVITAVATKNPMYGYMVSNIFKAFD